MALRIRIIDDVVVAMCAAKSEAKAGDIYLDDAQYLALMNKFANDFNKMHNLKIPLNISYSDKAKNIWEKVLKENN